MEPQIVLQLGPGGVSALLFVIIVAVIVAAILDDVLTKK